MTRIASKLLDERHVPHALVILMTIAGTPSIYAGDEQAFRGIKEHRVGGDDAIRPAFPATPADLAPFGWPSYRMPPGLIALRRQRPWLHRARSNILALHNTGLVVEASCESNRLWIVLNIADSPVRYSIDAAVETLAGHIRIEQKSGATEVEVSPHGWGILE